MQHANPNATSPPDEAAQALQRVYEEPRSARERHYGLMTRGGSEQELADDAG